MKKTYLFFLMTLLTLSNSSCSKDDDTGEGGNTFSSEIVGKWKYVEQGELDDNGNFVSYGYENDPNCWDYTQFNSNHTGEDVLHDWGGCNNPEIEYFNWSISGNILTLSMGFFEYQYQIMEVTDTTLKFSMEAEFEFNGEVEINTYVTHFEKM